MVTILEAATMAGLSKDKCRYWLKLLDLDATKQDGKLFLPAHAADLLQAMRKAVDSGMAPVAAAVEVKSIHALPVIQEVNQDKQNNDDIVLVKIADLEKSIMFLAQTVQQQSKIITDQANQLAILSTRLLPPPVEVKPVQVWQPAEKRAPKVSWLKRAWLELINPTALRATP
jgi:hypothetical protein